MAPESVRDSQSRKADGSSGCGAIGHCSGTRIERADNLSFHVPLRDNISDMCQDIYKEGRDVHGPATADSRYITEDAPFGLALTVVLGQLVQRPAMLHQSGLAILSAMYERDFYEENDLLKALDLENVDLNVLKQAALTGRLEDQRTLV